MVCAARVLGGVCGMQLCAGPALWRKTELVSSSSWSHQLVCSQEICVPGLSSRLQGQFGFSQRFSACSRVLWDCCVLSRRVSPAGPVWRADLKGILLGVRLELPAMMLLCGCLRPDVSTVASRPPFLLLPAVCHHWPFVFSAQSHFPASL